MREFFWKHDAGVKFSLLVLVVLASANLLLLNQGARISVAGQGVLPLPQVTAIDTCGEKCQETVKQKVAEAIASFSARPATVVTKQTATARASTVSMGSSFTTTNTSWTDITGGAVSIDIADYGSNPVVSWEASIKIANSNGTAYARLFDVTNGIAVSGSEVSVTSADYTSVSSENLNLWSGKNLYRVQIKSSTSQAASFASGTVKIVAK